MQTIMILGASQHQHTIIKAAKKMPNVESVVVDKDENAVGFQDADIKEIRSIKNKGAVLDLAIRHDIDGIIAPCADAGLRSAGLVVSKLNLKGVGASSIVCSMDKRWFNHVMREAGITVPEIYYDLDECERPFIIKPVDGVSSRGVHLIEDHDFTNLIHMVDDARLNDGEGKFMAQQYIPGTVFNFDCLLQNGQFVYKVIHDEYIDEGKNNFGADYFVYPSEYKEFYYDICKTCIDVIRTLQITDGNIAIEGVVHDGEVYILEVNPRMSGSYHLEVHMKATGIDWATDAINVALGNPVDIPTLREKPHGWVMVGSDVGGVFESYDPEQGGEIITYLKKKGDIVESRKGKHTSTDNAVAIVYVEGSFRNDVIKKLMKLRENKPVVMDRRGNN